MDFTPEALQTIGFGGVAFLAVLWILKHFISGINPKLDEVQDDVKTNNEYVKSVVEESKQINTNILNKMEKISDSYDEILHEVRSSNVTIAKSLDMFAKNQDTLVRILERQETRSQNIEIEVTKLSERVKK